MITLTKYHLLDEYRKLINNKKLPVHDVVLSMFHSNAKREMKCFIKDGESVVFESDGDRVLVVYNK